MKPSPYEPQGWPELLSASQVAQLLHIARGTYGQVVSGRLEKLPLTLDRALLAPSTHLGPRVTATDDL